MARNTLKSSTTSTIKKQRLYKCNIGNGSINAAANIEDAINKQRQQQEIISSLKGVSTRAGWCLGTAIEHLYSADGGRLSELITKWKVPESFRRYGVVQKNDTFRALVKIVTGENSLFLFLVINMR